MDSRFDESAGEAGKTGGMADAADGAGEHWLLSARAIVLAVSRRQEEFTSDDVWKAGLENPREPRALGPVMNSLAREGAIIQTGRFVKTARKTRHCAPIAVWRAAAPGWLERLKVAR